MREATSPNEPFPVSQEEQSYKLPPKCDEFLEAPNGNQATTIKHCQESGIKSKIQRQANSGKFTFKANVSYDNTHSISFNFPTLYMPMDIAKVNLEPSKCATELIDKC